MQDEFKEIIIDTQKEYKKSNKFRGRVIMLLIILLIIETILFGGFLWYRESAYEYVDTETEKTKEEILLETEGDNANAEYNNVEGNQYNDSATHNDNGGDE